MFLRYSKNNDGKTIYLCSDDSGIYVENDEIKILGDISIIKNGEINN